LDFLQDAAGSPAAEAGTARLQWTGGRQVPANRHTRVSPFPQAGKPGCLQTLQRGHCARFRPRSNTLNIKENYVAA